MTGEPESLERQFTLSVPGSGVEFILELDPDTGALWVRQRTQADERLWWLGRGNIATVRVGAVWLLGGTFAGQLSERGVVDVRLTPRGLAFCIGAAGWLAILSSAAGQAPISIEWLYRDGSRDDEVVRVESFQVGPDTTVYGPSSEIKDRH